MGKKETWGGGGLSEESKILTLSRVVRIREDQSSAMFIVDTYYSKDCLLVNLKSLHGDEIQRGIKLHQMRGEGWLLGKEYGNKREIFYKLCRSLNGKSWDWST